WSRASPAPGAGGAALPGGGREPESVVRGYCRLEEPGARADADHLGRLGPYGSLGDRERGVQKTEEQPRRDRDRQDAGPRALADDRRRLARGRRKGARVRKAVRMIGLASATRRSRDRSIGSIECYRKPFLVILFTAYWR